MVERLRHAKQGVTPKRHQSWRGVAHLPSLNHGCYGLGVRRLQLPIICWQLSSLHLGVTINRSHRAGSVPTNILQKTRKEGRGNGRVSQLLPYTPTSGEPPHADDTARIEQHSRAHLLRHCETHRESDTRLVQSSRMFSVSFLHTVCPALFSLSHTRAHRCGKHPGL